MSKENLTIYDYRGAVIKSKLACLNQAMTNKQGMFRGFARADKLEYECFWDDKDKKYKPNNKSFTNAKKEQEAMLKKLIKKYSKVGLTQLRKDNKVMKPFRSN